MRQRATAINLATTVTPIDPITHPQYWFYQKLKLSQAEQYLDLIESSPIQYPSSIESSRIQSSHFKYRIQNLRRHDQTGKLLYRIRSRV